MQMSAPMRASGSASAGIVTAIARFDASAQRTARNPVDDPAGEIVARIQATTAVKANAAVLRTADDMMGRLLDIRV